MKTIRVLLADDHEIVREGLRAILSADPAIDVVGEAANGLEVVANTQRLHPQVVIMDVTMPGLNGFEATRKLVESCRDAYVLVLTRHAQDAYARELLRAGAKGYVLKQSPSAELFRAVHAVAAGEQYVDRSLTAVPAPAHPRTAPTTALSPREEQVLRLVAQGFSNKEIASSLDVSVKTVEAHKANAGQKLGMNSRAEIVKYAQVRGWLSDF